MASESLIKQISQYYTDLNACIQLDSDTMQNENITEGKPISISFFETDAANIQAMLNSTSTGLRPEEREALNDVYQTMAGTTRLSKVYSMTRADVTRQSVAEHDVDKSRNTYKAESALAALK